MKFTQSALAILSCLALAEAFTVPAKSQRKGLVFVDSSVQSFGLTHYRSPRSSLRAMDDDEDDEDELYGSASDPLVKGADSVSWLPSVYGAKGDGKQGLTKPDSEIIPLFPLGSIVYIPNSEHVLNIFEPRYRKMYTDILMNGTKKFVVSMSHPEESGRFAQTGVLFELEDLKEVSEQTGDQIKYICNHKVTGRVKIHRILNPEAWETRETYLRVEGSISDDSGEDEEEGESSSNDVYGALAGAFQSIPKSETMLKSAFSILVDLQHELEEDVRFTRASVATLKTGPESDGLWQTIRLWQSFADQRLMARQNELQQDFQEKLQEFLRKEKGVDEGEMPSSISFSDLSTELQREVQELQKRMAIELRPLVNESTLTMQKILEAPDHEGRVELLKKFIEAEIKRLTTKKSLKGMFSAESVAGIPPEEQITEPESVKKSSIFTDEDDAFHIFMSHFARLRSSGLSFLAGVALTMLFLSHSEPLSSEHLLRSDFVRFLQDEQCTEACCQQYQEECESGNPFAFLPFAVQIIIMVILVGFSALFSGLTLGLMGLDMTGLEIVMESDDEVNAGYAAKIYPLREDGNLLLCTLLLGNVAVNALLSILMADKAGGIVGFLSSTFIIVIFGEIVPQAACSRYALEVGSKAVPIVRVIRGIFFPIAKPLAMCLDCALGEELATTYSNAEMLKLLQIHVHEEMIDPETAVAMTGALKYRDTKVKDVMTPLANTYMLSLDTRLNFETIAEIFKTGYSRIPVYEISKNNVIGLLFVKDLIFCDPEDAVRVADFVEIFGRGMHIVWPDDNLGDVLRELKQGKSHMALVRDVNNKEDDHDPYYEVQGIITLEDIIEEILGDEIVDETDAFVDGTHSKEVDRAQSFKWARLRLLDSKLVDETLTYDESRAVTAHLMKNYPDVVSLLTEHQLERLVSTTPVLLLPTAEQQLGQLLPKDLLYEKGVESDNCTLILAGRVTVISGSENFRSDVSSWCILGSGALKNSDYKADFSAYVSAGPCRCLRISRARFAAAIDGSTFERHEYSSHDMDKSQEELPGGNDSMNLRHLYPVPSTRQGITKDPEASSGALVEGGSRKSKFFQAFQLARREEKEKQEGSGQEGSSVGEAPKSSSSKEQTGGKSPEK